jgi:hypothetical protein
MFSLPFFFGYLNFSIAQNLFQINHFTLSFFLRLDLMVCFKLAEYRDFMMWRKSFDAGLIAGLIK